MDARNLATIFAPCILRADHDKLHATLAENEQQICIIETIILEVETIFTVFIQKNMRENFQPDFQIPKDLQCKIYNKLRETEPDRLDRILNNLSRLEGYGFFNQIFDKNSARYVTESQIVLCLFIPSFAHFVRIDLENFRTSL